MLSPLGSHSGHPVQPTDYSPSPRKYQVASRSHSPAGDGLVDSMLGKDADNVSHIIMGTYLQQPHPHTHLSIQKKFVRGLWIRMYMYMYCRTDLIVRIYLL